MKIDNPLSFKQAKIQSVLKQLAAQENCDGEPYDQMVLAAEYIDKLEARVAFYEQLMTGWQIYGFREPDEICSDKYIDDVQYFFDDEIEKYNKADEES